MALFPGSRRMYESPPCPRGAATLWLAAAALALLFVLLFVSFDALQADVARLRIALAEGQAARIAFISPREIESLRAAAGEAVAAEDQLQVTLAHVTAGSAPWPAILQRVIPTPPSEIEVTSLAQHGDRLTVRGTAAAEPALAAYVARLRGTLVFDDVQLESATANFVINLHLKGYEP